MIDLHKVWLPQILSHAQLVAETEILKDAWLRKSAENTSVTDLDELIEQVFEDSASEEMLIRADKDLNDERLVQLLRNFINSLLRVEKNHDKSSPSQVLDSAEWESSVEAAKKLINYAKENTDIEIP